MASTPNAKAAAPEEPVMERPTRTVVINNREGLVQGQLPHLGNDSSGRPQLGRVVTLLPGANLVSSEDLRVLRENPAFEMNFKMKIAQSLAPEQNPEKVGKPILEIAKSIGKDGVVDGEFPLQKLSSKECSDLIGETYTSSALNRWLRDEGRPDVRRDIQNQLDKLSGEAAPGGPAAVGR